MKIGAAAPKPSDVVPESEITRFWSDEYRKPLVSILCHCYNHGEYLEDSLKGFLMQKTDFPWEVIIHDDASTDNSADVIRQYAEKYPSIIRPILQKENQFSKGLTPSFFTTKAAQGEYFAPCDADDYWLDDSKLQKQADFLRNNPSFSVCGHDAFVVESGRVIQLSKLHAVNKADASPQRLSRGWFILTFTAMFRRNYDWYPEEHGKVVNGDTFFFTRLGRVGGYKYLDDLTPGAYRAHPGGIWSSMDQRQKDATSINTAYWMSQYYMRKGNHELSVYFSQKLSLISLEALDGMTFAQLVAFNYKLVRQLLRKRVAWLNALILRLRNRD